MTTKRISYESSLKLRRLIKRYCVSDSWSDTTDARRELDRFIKSISEPRGPARGSFRRKGEQT
jgi:hypothetical protein